MRTRQMYMRKFHFKGSRKILLVIVALILLMVARSGVAQSSNPPEGSSKPAGRQPTSNVESPQNANAPPGNAENGARLFQSIGCADCHGDDAEGAVGPPLVKIKKTFQEFESFVRNPSGAMPNEFPADLVSEDKLVDIYAFLERPSGSNNAAKEGHAAENPNPKPDAENGEKLFTSRGCDKCHASDQQVGASGDQTNAVPDSLQALIDYVRHPKGKMPAFTAAAVSDHELADIYAYLKSRPKP